MPAWFLITSFVLIFGGCGVKGKPMPPEEPVEMGYGRPLYPGANRSLEEQEPEEDRNKNSKSTNRKPEL